MYGNYLLQNILFVKLLAGNFKIGSTYFTFLKQNAIVSRVWDIAGKLCSVERKMRNIMS